MDIENFLKEIIPPADYQHRDGFSNSDMIDRLNEYEKELVGDALINKLLGQTDDTLIVETLASLRSEKSLPLLYDFLERCSDLMSKIIVAVSIFKINNDNDLVFTAIASFKQLDDTKDPYYVYKLIPAFYYLVKLRSIKVRNLIEEYTEHKEYLISYNAKQALGEQ